MDFGVVKPETRWERGDSIHRASGCLSPLLPQQAVPQLGRLVLGVDGQLNKAFYPALEYGGELGFLVSG